MKKHVLIVENDQLLQQILLQALQPLYACSVSSSLRQGFDLLETRGFDLVVLDRVLDDGDGLELISYLQEFAYPTHVLIISMLKNWQEKVHGLRLGADDYLPKPFAIPELLVRVEHLLHQQKLSPSSCISAGRYHLYTTEGRVEFDRNQIQLRKKESRILACLLLHKNQTVSRARIIQYAWPTYDTAPQFDTLEVYVRRLRVKLREMGTHIKTVRGFGYRFDEPTAAQV